MFLKTCTHWASKSSAPTMLPASSVASWPAMNSHSEAFFTRVICEYWPSGLPRPSGLKIVISAGTALLLRRPAGGSGPRIAHRPEGTPMNPMPRSASRKSTRPSSRCSTAGSSSSAGSSSGETIAVVSDLGTRREYIQAAFAAADELGADIYEMCVNSIPAWTKVGVPTIGKCKGTLEAVSAADMIVIFHVPLFTKWLKQVMDGGTRVLMIIDAPDDLEQLMSPPGLKEAMQARRGDLPRRRRRCASPARPAPTSPIECGEYPVMTQWGYADEPGHFDHWGGGHIHTFPNEGSAHGKVVFAAGRHRDPALLPLRRRSGAARDPRRPRRAASKAASTPS